MVSLDNEPCSLESARLDNSQETSLSPRKYLSLWQQILRLMKTSMISTELRRCAVHTGHLCMGGNINMFSVSAVH